MKKRQLRRLMRNKDLRRTVRTYNKGGNYFGWLVLIIGVILVLKDLGYLPTNLNPFFSNISLWAIIIVIAGILLIIRGRS